MHGAMGRRAAAGALALTLAAAGVAAADTVPADADAVTPGSNATVDLGPVGPGESITVDVAVALVCANASHVARGTTITIGEGPTNVPDGGSLAFSGTTIGPVPETWPLSGSSCPSPAPTLDANGPVRVTLTAPAAGGLYTYDLVMVRTPSTGLTGMTAATFRLEVVANTPPTLALPADFTVEADTTGGWTADYAPSSSDAEDDPDPAVTCEPAPGALLPLGATTVSCSATDTGDLTSPGSFTVTVTDTTAPTLAVPLAVAVETTDPAGTAVTWAPPTAVDVVDPAPSVACVPASGSLFSVGTTTVTCTARDASGNLAQAAFDVSVSLRRLVSVSWAEPVGGAASMTVNHGRTLPLKATIAVSGDGPVSAPQLRLERLDACGGSVVEVRSGGALDPDGGRWTSNLDTTPLALGCWRVSVVVDGTAGGSFELRLVDGAVGGGNAGRAAGSGGGNARSRAPAGS